MWLITSHLTNGTAAQFNLDFRDQIRAIESRIKVKAQALDHDLEVIIARQEQIHGLVVDLQASFFQFEKKVFELMGEFGDFAETDRARGALHVMREPEQLLDDAAVALLAFEIKKTLLGRLKKLSSFFDEAHLHFFI
jgi:hypothetical protein